MREVSDTLRSIGTDGFEISFNRTLRIPDDGKTYPLPPGLDRFPILPVEKVGGSLPECVPRSARFLIPMYQQEALWISFSGAPHAVQVFVGGVNAVSGKENDAALRENPKTQNYLVGPDQPWLDGISSGHGFIRQFVAMPLGGGYTVEEQLTEHADGGVRIRIYPLKPGIVLPEPPHVFEICSCSSPMMGLGAGGKMKQQIDVDPYGVSVWDQERAVDFDLAILNTEQWESITGEAAPPTPIDARTYTQYGLPWFDLWRDATPAVPASTELEGVKSVAQIDALDGSSSGADETIPIPSEQVVGLQGPSWPKA